MTKRASIYQAQASAQTLIIETHKKLRSWAAVNDCFIAHYGVKFNRGVLSGIASSKRRATRPMLRALGIEFVEMGTGRLCPIHGIVHDRQCREQRYRRLADMPTAVLRWKLENREEMK